MMDTNVWITYLRIKGFRKVGDLSNGMVSYVYSSNNNWKKYEIIRYFEQSFLLFFSFLIVFRVISL